VANFTGANPGIRLDVRLSGKDYSNVLVGRYTWQVGSGNPEGVGAPTGAFETFCIELNDTFVTPVTFQVDALENGPDPGPPNPMGEVKANLIRELWGRFYQDIDVGPNQGIKAAAFQVSVWEIVHDTLGFSSGAYTGRVNTGSFTVTGGSDRKDVIKLANSWLSQLTNDASYREQGLVALISTYEQDQVTLRPTPAPPALVSGLIGIFGVAGYYYRRRQKAS
jgi:hypothetical protein